MQIKKIIIKQILLLFVSSARLLLNVSLRGATNPEINLDLAPNPCYLDLDLDLYATFGFGFGLVCYVWIWIWICSPSLGICLDLTV
jgi:hypothetical protein